MTEINPSEKRKRKTSDLLLLSAALAASGLVMASIASPLISEAHNGFPNYGDINRVTLDEKQTRMLKSSVYADAPIPSLPDSFIKSNLVYAYGWLDTNTGNALTATIHPNFRDSTKNPDHWHMHPMALGKGTETSNYCVEAFNDGLSTAEGGVSISGSAMNISVSSSKARLNPSDIDAISSLILVKDPSCPEISKLIDGDHTTIRLGAIIHDTEALTR